MSEEKIKKPIYKRWWFILGVLLILSTAFNSEDEEPKKTDEANAAPVVEQTIKEDKGVDYNVTGDIKVEIKDDKVIATITSNVIDGTIFEVLIMDSKFESVSGFLTIKKGKASKEFEIPEAWDIGYLGVTASIRFNLDEHPQPESVKQVYGENGEKLEGDLSVDNNLGGKNINLKTSAIPYPDEKTVKAKQDEIFADAIAEIKKLGDGIIVDVEPYIPSEGWSMVKVIVNDSWYYSQEHEKERFAEQVGDTVATIIQNTGQVEPDKHVSVYFYDAYDKELASPKILGGYKIKK